MLKKIVLLFLLILIIGLILLKFFRPTPKIAIPDEIESQLNYYEYPIYVNNLNLAYNGDSFALYRFLKIDDMSDGASYQHGIILIKLLNKVGDYNFSKAVIKLNACDKEIVYDYIETGSDLLITPPNLEKEYPLTYAAIK